MGNMFKGRVAIVTGGGSGLGEGLCKVLARRKTYVVVADINLEAAQTTLDEIVGRGGEGEAYQLDVAHEHEIQSCVDDVVQRRGRLDFMFNNAGIMVGGEVQDIDQDDWQKVIDVNLWGMVNGSKIAYEVMRKQGSGYIVNTASITGITGAPWMAAYAATESATIGYTLSLRDEAAAHGVKASVICPGYIQSNLFKEAQFKHAEREAIRKKLPFRGAKPEKAAEAAIDGIRKNQPMIIFPLHARLLWWLNRLNPSLVTPLSRQTVKNYRKLKQEPAETVAGE